MTTPQFAASSSIHYTKSDRVQLFDLLNFDGDDFITLDEIASVIHDLDTVSTDRFPTQIKICESDSANKTKVTTSYSPPSPSSIQPTLWAP